jgi:asparagine synthase (glutamine-hydrolysing)
MCGICGAIDWSGSGEATSLVRRMTPTMRHRGPDDEGYLTSESLALGMRRLSIIDLATGHQPIFNEDGSVGVVVNGEIYNYRELTDQLCDRGHSFNTRSDSEVIAHAYEEWGPDCVEHLQGMFAFAVYDRRGMGNRGYAGRDARAPSDEGGTLFLARDRLGIKPLYYYAEGISNCEFRISSFNDTGGDGAFVFASEVRTLLASGVVPRRLSRAALESYLLFGSVSEPMTLVEGVLSIPPGHRMTIPLGHKTTAPRPEPYWNISASIARNGHTAKNDVKATTAHVRELLEASVRRHLIADVPVGVFLSSGIDSTALAALASREVSGVHTFTVAFPNAEFSEATIARRTAEKFGTKHQELMLSGDEMLRRLGEAVGALDQPSMDGINTYFVSWGARQAGLKVALSGLGGDEVFGGYSTFRRTPRYQHIAAVGSRVPGGLRSAMASAIAGIGEGTARGDAARKIAALWDSPESLPHPYFFARALFTPPQVAGLMSGAETARGDLLWWNWLAESAEQARKLDPFTAVSCMEARSYLISTLLRDTDSMSMAHSLEVRVPFLDHLLVEFVIQLPQEMKLRKATPKALLVDALADLLPSEVVNQAKRGFTFPWAAWLRGPLKASIEQGLSELSPALQEAMNAETASGIWRSFLDGHTSWSRPWSLYVLNEWTKRHLD